MTFCRGQDASFTDSIPSEKSDYYVMEGEYMIHYTIEIKADTLFNDVPLKKGKRLTSRSEILDKRGRIKYLNEGDCVDHKGNVKDCDTLRENLEEKKEQVVEEKSLQPL